MLSRDTQEEVARPVELRVCAKDPEEDQGQRKLLRATLEAVSLLVERALSDQEGPV